ncbi:hypothetical protein [Bacteroides sp.]|uniref:hypothetical protein n=1 Tax=Bacteroides sp. TaxID=29523 RepID=UPI0026190714|nr:hypothetical protein [Bacteroides sp.]MDD3038653.1 hypothetical protein [Bacteroides sp.]
MKEKYNVVISERQAVPRSKRMREAGQSASSAAVLVSGSSDTNNGGNGHTHTNLADLERIGLDTEGYQTIRVGNLDEETGEVIVTHEKVKAGYADKAAMADKADYADKAGISHDLDQDSPVNERFLNKTKADQTKYHLGVGGLTSKDLIQANNGLVIRKQEIVEEPVPMSMSLTSYGDHLTEETEDSLIEEINTVSPGSAATLGELTNVADDADDTSETNDILVRNAGTEEWSVNSTLLSQVSQLMTKVFPFTLNLSGGGTYEKGSVQTVTLSWTYDRSIESQTVNNEALDTTVRSKQYPGVTTDTEYTLNAISGGQSYTKSVAAKFRLKKYYGVSPNKTITNEEILTLTSAWAERPQASTIFNCTGGKYPYYILPTSITAGIQFWIGGLRNTDWTEETKSITNAYGYTENYTIYRLNNTQTGVLNIEIR